MLHSRSIPNPSAGLGFTLVELLVTVAVMGILGGLSFVASQTFVRRDQANTAAAELAAWLEPMAARASSVGPCEVTFTTGNGLAPGSTFATLATGSSADCTPEATLRLPSLATNQTYNVAVTYAPTTATSISFSRRGGVVADGVEATVKVAVASQLPVRCVRISFATVNIGRNNTTADVSQNCTEWQST
jgi:prepilin-type N-terminal cleavage/methylation domain-containing protein